MKYEFTLTLHPSNYINSAADQHKNSKQILTDIFYPNGFPAYQVTCIAELTQDHNVHYHCMIDLKDLEIKDKLMNKFRRYRRVFGRKTCTQVVYEESYKAYLVKDLDKTRRIIGDPVVCDFYGVATMKFLESIEGHKSNHKTES